MSLDCGRRCPLSGIEVDWHRKGSIMSSYFSKPTRREKSWPQGQACWWWPHMWRGRKHKRCVSAWNFASTAATRRCSWARRAGFSRDQGINITMDGSGGSVKSVTRVATGTHPFGLANLGSSLVEFTSRNRRKPREMTVFDRFPAVVLSLKRKPIKTLQELVGTRVGTGSVDAGSKILTPCSRSTRSISNRSTGPRSTSSCATPC